MDEEEQTFGVEERTVEADQLAGGPETAVTVTVTF